MKEYELDLGDLHQIVAGGAPVTEEQLERAGKTQRLISLKSIRGRIYQEWGKPSEQLINEIEKLENDLNEEPRGYKKHS